MVVRLGNIGHIWKPRFHWKKFWCATAWNYIWITKKQTWVTDCCSREKSTTITREVALSRLITVTKVQQLLEATSSIAGRKRTVLLLDDAALTLTPAYLIELLDVVRALKTSTIAPKTPVYPGTTEYSPRFHTGQDSTDVFVWTSVEAEEYATSMDQIARCRFQISTNYLGKLSRFFVLLLLVFQELTLQCCKHSKKTLVNIHNQKSIRLLKLISLPVLLNLGLFQPKSQSLLIF